MRAYSLLLQVSEELDKFLHNAVTVYERYEMVKGDILRMLGSPALRCRILGESTLHLLQRCLGRVQTSLLRGCRR